MSENEYYVRVADDGLDDTPQLVHFSLEQALRLCEMIFEDNNEIQSLTIGRMTEEESDNS